MARVTYVKKARQRFAMVADIDLTTGEQKVVPVLKRDGTPKKTKTGREVTRRLTVQDRTRPLGNLKCDFAGCDISNGEIEVGQAYMHITPRSGPYGGTQKNRHNEHPSWQVWEYSYSRRAQVARTQSEMHKMLDSYEFTETTDFDDCRDQLAEMASEQRDEQEEALNNMPEGLQDGSPAQENHEALESWVDGFEDAPEPTEDEHEDCDTCAGTGKVTNPDYDEDVEQEAAEEGREYEEEEIDCEDCDGSGKTEDLSEEWIESARDSLRDAIDSCEI